MEINDILKMEYDFLPNSSNVSHEFVMILSWVYCSFQKASIPKGNKVGKMHVMRFGFYSLINML
jgi:hypothetical protein